jgi:hypothetical protein
MKLLDFMFLRGDYKEYCLLRCDASEESTAFIFRVEEYAEQMSYRPISRYNKTVIMLRVVCYTGSR